MKYPTVPVSKHNHQDYLGTGQTGGIGVAALSGRREQDKTGDWEDQEWGIQWQDVKVSLDVLLNMSLSHEFNTH